MNQYIYTILWITAAWLFCGFVGMLLADVGDSLAKGSYVPSSIETRIAIILFGFFSLCIGFCLFCDGIWHFLKPKINKILDFEI